MDSLRTHSKENRTVHARAVTPDSVVEIVRYDRAGKWYLESTWGPRQHMSIRDAAGHAKRWEFETFYGLPGGSMFDRIVRGEA